MDFSGNVLLCGLEAECAREQITEERVKKSRAFHSSQPLTPCPSASYLHLKCTLHNREAVAHLCEMLSYLLMKIIA